MVEKQGDAPTHGFALDATAQWPVGATVRPDHETKLAAREAQTLGSASTHSFAEAPTMAQPAGSSDGQTGVGASTQSQAFPHISLAGRTGAPRSAEQATDVAGPDLEVTGRLGEGGMGVVLLARQRSVPREVAVKTVRPSANVGATEAIFAEGRIAGSLEHPSIVPVHALGVDDEGAPVLVMKRIDGVPWSELLHNPHHEVWSDWIDEPDGTAPTSATSADLPEPDSWPHLLGHLRILLQVCNAIHFAHSRKVVHRDIKPENVLIGRFGDVYVVDWGVAARLGPDGASGFCGTPGYLAPEVAVEGKADERTDVYLLGATLHEILTGRMRHDAKTTARALALAVVSAPHDYDASVPAELAALCNRACHSDPAERPASAVAFRDDLRAFLAHRASHVLCAEATDRFRVAKEHASQKSREAEDLRALEHAAAEARFGFVQALRQWEGNREARVGLKELDAFLDSRRQRTVELERLAHDHDVTVGHRSRNRVLAVLATLGVLTSSSILVSVDEMTPAMMFGVVIALSSAIATTAFFFRKKLMGTAFNRQGILFIGSVMAVLILSRAVNLAHPVPTHEVFTRDAFMMAGACAVAGVTLLRWAYVLAVVMAVAAAVCALFPSYALRVFGFSTGAIVVLAAFFSWRGTPQQASDS